MKALLTISTSVALAAASIYHLTKYHNALHHDSIGSVTSSPHISDALDQSAAVRIVNPHRHVPIHDTRHTTISLSNGPSDEEILARFVKGFFGGYGFGLERSLLRASGKEITRFDTLGDTPISSHIWSTTQLSTHELPPLHALLFGVFRVVESQVELRQTSSRTYSYIDFAFGSDNGFIAGVHRFSVAREAVEVADEKDIDDTSRVVIEFAHSGCNPKENKPLKPDFLQTLHLWYAMFLFREGVAEVNKAH